MTLADFIAKKRREVQAEGFATAAYRGVGEPASKALSGYADRRATPIWDAEWDVALVLDAARADLWAEVAPEYDLPSASTWSVGSASVEWIAKTFDDEYRDAWSHTGHVTANPHTGHPPDFNTYTDGNVYPLRERGLPYLDEVYVDRWKTTEDLPTVEPKYVTDRAMWAWDRRERLGFDQLLVHYMQPHIPFRSRPEWSPGWSNKLQFGKPLAQYGKRDDWEQLRDGDLDADEVWAAYADNLRWVLDEVQRWLETTDATVLITADHGNGMGEWGVYGHPPGNGLPDLRRVPFVTVKGTRERDMQYSVTADPPVHREPKASEKTTDKLQALGYR